jgi:ABC-type glycerol-3-phosphate transport system substrate-binding protein
MRSTRACALVCLCALACLSGCAVLATPTPEPVTITFLHDNANGRYYEDLLPLFSEQYPHITVKLSTARTRGEFNGLVEAGVDVYELFAGALLSFYNVAAVDLREQVAMLTLSAFVEQDDSFDLADFYPVGLGLATLDGELRGVPVVLDCGVMAYNQELFDQYGVPYPQNGWTWDEFLVTAMMLRDPDEGVYGFAPQLLDPMYFEYIPHWIDPLYFVYANGGQIFDDWKHPTRATFDHPRTVEAIEWYDRLLREHEAAPTPAEARASYGGDPRGYFGFVLGRAGMMVAGVGDRFRMPSVNRVMRRGVVTVPRGEQSVSLCVGSALSISARSKQIEASWQWISWVSKQVPRRGMPARRSVAESKAYEDSVGEADAATVRATLESDVVLPLYPYGVYLEEIELFNDAVREVCEGTATAGEALYAAQQRSKLK